MGSTPTEGTKVKVMGRKQEFMSGLEPRGNYRRVLPDDRAEAERLFRLGYRQTSNRFGVVARVDVSDLDEALRRQTGGSSSKWNRWSKEDYWRRCYSKDKLTGVNENVMRCLRKLGRPGSEWKHGIAEQDRDVVGVCVDNDGIEESFDQGVEYVVGRFILEKGMISVFDKFGREIECMVHRFKIEANPR